MSTTSASALSAADYDAIASAVMGAAAYWTEIRLSDVLGHTGMMPRALSLGGGIAAGVLTLAATAKLLRLSEFGDAMGAILRRMKGSSAAR